jgi:DNA-binding NarL/FixJ family response regulator
MAKGWERVKAPLVVTENGAKISLIGTRTEPEDELQLHRIDPQNNLKFPATVNKRTELNSQMADENRSIITYRNGILVEFPDDDDRWIYTAFNGQFDSYPTATAAIIDRIEQSLDWEAESNYPLRLNKFRIPRNRRDIPVNILNEGKSVVAAYLYIIHGWSKDEVAEMLELSPETVQQYLTNVRTGNR